MEVNMFELPDNASYLDMLKSTRADRKEKITVLNEGREILGDQKTVEDRLIDEMCGKKHTAAVSEFLGPTTAAKSRSPILRGLARGVGYVGYRANCQKYRKDPEKYKECIKDIPVSMKRDMEYARQYDKRNK
jgi:hypothetical protein